MTVHVRGISLTILAISAVFPGQETLVVTQSLGT
jgi:hypothetical protein